MKIPLMLLAQVKNKWRAGKGMGSVRRVYVEKKEPYAVRARELKEEIRNYLGIEALEAVRVLSRDDVENLS